jgi:flagellum-specific ATP synthase
VSAASIFAEREALLAGALTARLTARVRQVVGLVIEATGLSVPVGAYCRVHARGGAGGLVDAEVVGFRQGRTLLMPCGELRGVAPGDVVECVTLRQAVPVGRQLLGRIIGGAGEPLDDKGPLFATEDYPLYTHAPDPLRRRRISQPMAVGIRSVDGLLTIGAGQRMGVFSGSGVGKSIMLGMIARNTAAEVNVIGLVGERGREVREFLERDLGAEGLARSVVVVATSDRPALMRVRAAHVACAVAEYFRDLGKDVLLMMDSVTRVAFAQREIGLSVGEPPATKGYPPSVFALLPRLLERAGASEKGSITGLYAVLVEADDLGEPISDAVRGTLDGHIVLSRGLANRGHYPAVDVLASVSRVMPDVISKEHRAAAGRAVASMAVYRLNEDLINIGAYVDGSDPEIDAAKRMRNPLNEYLRQDMFERTSFAEARDRLVALFPPAGPAGAVPAPRPAPAAAAGPARPGLAMGRARR